jgi:hypothetical protein
MVAHVRQLRTISSLLPPLVFAAGLLALAAMGRVLYLWTCLGTEALLVPWQCD